MDPLTVIGLAKFVPDIIGLFDKRRGKDAKKAIQKVGEIAEAVTGQTGSNAEKAIANDPNLALEFQLAVMADTHVQDQLELEDRKSARELYKINPGKAEDVAEQVMRYNLVLVFLLVVINVLAVAKLKDDAAVLAIVSNFIGIAMHALLNERQAVVGFFFGSSLGSKLKNTGEDK